MNMRASVLHNTNSLPEKGISIALIRPHPATFHLIKLIKLVSLRNVLKKRLNFREVFEIALNVF